MVFWTPGKANSCARCAEESVPDLHVPASDLFLGYPGADRSPAGQDGDLSHATSTFTSFAMFVQRPASRFLLYFLGKKSYPG